MEQQFKDFLIAYDADKQETKDWRIKYDDRLKPLEDMKLLFERPAKVIGVILVLMVTPFLGVLGWNCFKWTANAVSRILSITKIP